MGWWSSGYTPPPNTAPWQIQYLPPRLGVDDVRRLYADGLVSYEEARRLLGFEQEKKEVSGGEADSSTTQEDARVGVRGW